MINFSESNEHEISIPCDEVKLEGILTVPSHARGIVMFVHGSGSSRFSERNQFVARFLQKNNFATLLFDLLTAEEDKIDSSTAEFRFNIPFLAKRLQATTQWVLNNPALKLLPIGYFGASTGGAAAIVAAANLAEVVKAVVSRGGRPDLAGESLLSLQAATLLIVGKEDHAVIPLNEEAYNKMNCVKQMELISGATHLFEEPGRLEMAATLASDWFLMYLKK